MHKILSHYFLPRVIFSAPFYYNSLPIRFAVGGFKAAELKYKDMSLEAL